MRDIILKTIIVAWVGAVKALAEGESNSNHAESGTWRYSYRCSYQASLEFKWQSQADPDVSALLPPPSLLGLAPKVVDAEPDEPGTVTGEWPS